MNKKMEIYSVLLGIGCGVLNAIILLFLMIQNNYQVWNFGFWMILIIALTLPAILDPMEKKGFLLKHTKITMILVSLVICIGYTLYVTGSVQYDTGSTAKNLFITTGMTHIIPLFTSMINGMGGKHE